ncbi:hypothetical protein V6C27_02460 [Peptococcaceae bacterium 1198_IL3148]
MYNHIFEFINHLYNNGPHPPIFLTDLIRMSDKNIKTKAQSKPTITHKPEHRHTYSSDNVIKKEIKALVVLHKEKILKYAEGVIPAPIGVEIDSKTGQLTVPVEIIPVSEVILNPKVVNNLLINEGFVKVKIIAYISDPEPCHDERKCITKEATVPIQSVHQIGGIYPDDDIEEKVHIKSISVIGIPDNSLPKSVGQRIDLAIKIVLEVKLIISRKEIISVLACNN